MNTVYLEKILLLHTAHYEAIDIYMSSMLDPGPNGCFQSLLLTGSHHGAAATYNAYKLLEAHQYSTAIS